MKKIEGLGQTATDKSKQKQHKSVVGHPKVDP
jgi:hypothetical protein